MNKNTVQLRVLVNTGSPYINKITFPARIFKLGKQFSMYGKKLFTTIQLENK